MGKPWGQPMRIRGKRWGPYAWCLGLAGLVAAGDSATAQSLFEALFGARQPRAEAARAYAPHGYADPGRDESDPFARGPGPGRMAASAGAGRPGGTHAYCVRLCDGRYFPLQRHGDTTPAELCGAVCPASRTKIFFGSDIEGARAHDGTRYSALDTAFVYRQRLVPDCTCNGKTAFGLAPLDPASDPTLRPGDIVATKDGLMTFQGSRRRGAAAFTPIDRSRLARERLGQVTVAGRN